MPVSPVTSIRAGKIRQHEGGSAVFFELTYLDPALLLDFLAVLDLLDLVRQGFFDMIHIVPSASTWSRARHSCLAGQHPLRSKSSPLGLSSLSLDDSEKIHHANRELEIIAWVAEQALHCPSIMVGLTLIFPEDLGGHISDGPSSLWALREFQLLEGTRDARRAAGNLCQFTRADYKRPIGVLSNCIHLRDRLSLGWPSFRQVQDRLVYKGPLPLRCSCGYSHSPLIGVSEDSAFRPTAAAGFGPGFWGPCVYDDTLERRFGSLRDGDQPDFTPLGVSPLLSPSLASGPSSLRSTYEAWKAGTLSRLSLADIAPPDAIAAYFSESPGLRSSRSTLRSLLEVSSVPASASSLKVSPVPGIMLSRARSRSPSRTKKPLVLLRPRGDVSSAVSGAPPGSLSARCVVFTVSLC